jgi:hypothetical protein
MFSGFYRQIGFIISIALLMILLFIQTIFKHSLNKALLRVRITKLVFKFSDCNIFWK